MKLGTIGSTTGMAATPQVSIGATARALKPLEQAAGIAADQIYAGRKEEKAEAEREYQIGVQLANKYNAKNAEAQSKEAYAASITGLGKFAEVNAGREFFDANELAGYNLDIPMTEIIAVDGQEQEVPRKMIPAHEVVPQMFKSHAESVVKANQNRMDPERLASIKAEAEKAHLELSVNAINELAKESKAKEDNNIDNAIRQQNFELASELINGLEATDLEKSIRLVDLSIKAEVAKGENAIREKDLATIQRLKRMYSGKDVGLQYGEMPAFMGMINAGESNNYFELNREYASHAPQAIDVTSSTIDEVLAFQTEWLENQYAAGAAKRGEGSSALGRYQIVSKTLKQAVEELGLGGDEVFSQEMQDYIAKEFLLKAKRPKLQKYMEAISITPAMENAALKDLGSEWEYVKNLPREEGLEIVRNMRGDAQASFRSQADERGEELEDWMSRGGDNGSNMTPRKQTDMYNRLSAAENGILTSKKGRVKGNITATVRDAKILGEQIDSGLQTSVEQEQEVANKLYTAAAGGSKEAQNSLFELERKRKRRDTMSFIANHSEAESEQRINEMEASSDGSAESIDEINHARLALKKNKQSYTTDMQSHMVKVGVVELSPISFTGDSVAELSEKLNARYANKLAGESQFNVKDANILEEEAAKSLLSDIENTANPELRMDLITKINSAFGQHSTELFYQLSSRDGSKYAAIANKVATGQADVALIAMQGEQIANADYNKGKVIGGTSDQLKIFFDEALNGALGGQTNVKSGRYKLMYDIYAKQATNNGVSIHEFDNDTAEQVVSMAMGRVVEVGNGRIEVPNKNFSSVDFSFEFSDLVSPANEGGASYDSYLRDFLPQQLAAIDAYSFNSEDASEIAEKVRDGEIKAKAIGINSMHLMQNGLPLMLKNGEPIELQIYNPNASRTIKRRTSVMPPDVAGVPSSFVPTGGESTTIETAGSIYGPLDEAARGM